MIIKELKIDAFGGVINRVVSFSDGINIIFGENEKGKSTMEAFIKIMLYGLPPKRGKTEGDRKHYLPFNGGVMKGAMVVEHKGREYIIQRTFGATKKEDVSSIIDALTGEEVNDINNEEPGKSFLGINRSTFERTLFINQLGVSFSKDKEEEIMDKITTIFGCGEDEVPAAKALEKLESSKKELITSRGVGALDQLKKKYSTLLEERYEGYNLAEQNLEWENELLNEKNNRKILHDEISKLEVYKKYLKKINLQKEYKDITEFLKKSEELKRKEKEINKNLGNDIIDENFIDELKDENKIYLGLIDRKSELEIELSEYEEKLNNNKKHSEEYKFLELFEDGIKEKLVDLKYEQKNIHERLQYANSINNSIKADEEELSKKSRSLGIDKSVQNFGDEIEIYLKEYEDALRELKFIIETNDINKSLDKYIKEETVKRVGGCIAIVVGALLSFFGLPILIVALVLIGIGAMLVFKSTVELKELSIKNKAKEKVDLLNKRIGKIEEYLNKYVEELHLKDYSELILYLNKYKSFKEYENRILFRIEEKKKLIDEEEYSKIKTKFNKNYEMLNSLKDLSNCENIDDIIEKINVYEELSRKTEVLVVELNNLKKNINSINMEIEDRELKIRRKLEIMNLDLGSLLDLEVYIKEYKEKINKRNEIHGNLKSMEETYKVLLKDRDIESIKEELKDIINENNEYSYQSEEEIENEEKRKSSQLIECEKKIKDLENSINTRMIGKRTIVEIEEEVSQLKNKIVRGENKVKALEIAIKVLGESFTEIRRDVGPAINTRITEKFNLLTDNKYNEVMLGDNYEMMVNDRQNLFKGSYLSNGTWDQLYLSLRLTFIDLLFENEEYPIILDDAFVQYDDKRREKALLLINHNLKRQILIFTCQTKEEELLKRNNISINIINL